MARDPKIIVYGQDEILLNSRAWVLQASGLEVGTTTDLQELTRQHGEIELLILCHTLSLNEVSSAIELFQMGNSKIKQLLLLSGPTTQTITTSLPTVDPLAGPPALIKTVRTMVGQRSK